MSSPHERLGQAATEVLVEAARVWPKRRDLQQILAPAVREYQERQHAFNTYGQRLFDAPETTGGGR